MVNKGKKLDLDPPQTSVERAREIAQLLEQDLQVIRGFFEDRGRYYTDDVLSSLESYISLGLRRINEDLGSSDEPEKIDEILRHLDYLLQQKQLFYVRKAIMDDDTSSALPLKDIANLGAIEDSLRKSPRSVVAIGLNPQSGDLPQVQGFLPWEDVTGLKINLLVADGGVTATEKAIALGRGNTNQWVMYKDDDIDAFFASLMVSGQLDVDDEISGLLVQVIRLNGGNEGALNDEALQLNILWENKDLDGLIDALSSKKKLI